MSEAHNYIQDLAEIRTMMQRSTKFLSLSGMAGVMAGIYALAGSYIAHYVLHFRPVDFTSGYTEPVSAAGLVQLNLLALGILVLAIGTAIILSGRKARSRGEKIWNATSRRLLVHMGVPLFTGGVLVLVLLAKGATGLLVPATLVFYGLSLFNAGMFTYGEIKSLGLIQIALGLLSACFAEAGLLFWAIGFGIFHIIYGIFIHYRYER